MDLSLASQINALTPLTNISRTIANVDRKISEMSARIADLPMQTSLGIDPSTRSSLLEKAGIKLTQPSPRPETGGTSTDGSGEGFANLVLSSIETSALKPADSTEANLIALTIRQSLGTASLSLANQSQQSILSLLR